MRSTSILIALLLLYLIVSIHGLGSSPPIFEDEPWIASASYKLATTGVFGSDIFAGYYGMDHGFYYAITSLFLLLLAGVFKVAGFGLVQMRILPVALGGALMLVTYLVGRRTVGKWAALLAVGVMVLLRVASHDGEIGIPLLDIARICRPEVAVPLFGLLAFLLFERASRSTARWWWVLCGACIAISTLFNLYGIFWLPSLLLLLLLRDGPRMLRHPAPYLIVIGFLLPLVPQAIYSLSGGAEFVGQSRINNSRFELLDLGFYLHNLLHEPERYGRFMLRGGDWMRPGALVAMLLLPASMIVALKRLRGSRSDGAGTIALLLLLQAGLFAMLILSKNYRYMISIWPLAALLIGWLAIEGWKRWNGVAARAVMIGVALLLAAEAGWKVVDEWREADAATSYQEFAERLQQAVPRDGRVLGLQHWWPALHDRDFRTWLVPMMLSDSMFHQAPIPLDSALSIVDPDLIMMDERMRRYFREIDDPGNKRHLHGAQFRDYMTRHHATLIATIEDKTYGRIEVWRVR